MTRASALLVHLEQKSVTVAVVIRFAHKLSVATGITLAPQLTAAAAVVNHASLSKSHA